MKTQMALAPKQDRIAVQPVSITKFWEKIDRLMKQTETRAFELFEERGREFGRDWEDWFKAEEELITPVPIQFVERNNELRIKVEVPEFTEDEIEINVEKNMLTIYGDKTIETEEKGNATSDFLQIYRKVSLPCDVVPEKAVATLRDGVLEIVAPKSAIKGADDIAAHAA